MNSTAVLLLSPPLLVTAASADRSFGIVGAFVDAGPVDKLVLGILIAFSIGSWTVMIAKYLQLRRVGDQNRRFIEIFRRSSRFSEINSVTAQHKASPLVGLFQAGYIEIDSQIKAQTRAPAATPGARYRIQSLAGVERCLRRAVGVEVRSLSRYAHLLATTASATPFIGLFGTVWGIMVAFGDIGTSGSASIVAVAPGIAGALVNTAAGLVAAVPALIGYNQLANHLRTVRAEMEDFALEFLNLAEKNFT